jgi:hypothetical protein
LKAGFQTKRWVAFGYPLWLVLPKGQVRYRVPVFAFSSMASLLANDGECKTPNYIVGF